ncbi:MAG: hypothetical protein RR825_05580, partial [Ruthenibacterium sp.]
PVAAGQGMQQPSAAPSVLLAKPTQAAAPVGISQSVPAEVPWRDELQDIAPPVAQNTPPFDAPSPIAPRAAAPLGEQVAQASAQDTAQTRQADARGFAKEQSVPEAALEPFAAWPEVIAAMEPKDTMLFVYMRNSKAYFDGKRVRIDGSELFLEYMRRSSESKTLIKETIAQVVGKGYSIGPYERPKQTIAAGPTAEDALARLEAQGVSVVYKDKQGKQEE